MINKVMAYASMHNMFEENDYVVAGVSGGADSVCLLFVLLEIRKQIPIEIHVVHINHGIRKEAEEDAAYVEALCKRFELPFTLVEKNVCDLAQREGLSTEEAGRKVRYQAFSKVLDECALGRKGKIAIAHNLNDCSETFLFHLFRGSGLKGLSGIRPVRESIIRPLMCLERQEIEAYLEQNQIAYCIDKTNFEDNYTRNKIRHHILPYAEQEICQGAVAHVKAACDKISDACDFMEDMVKDAYEKCVTQEAGKYHINQAALENVHRTLRSYLLMEVMTRAAGNRKDIEEIHIVQLEALFEKQCGKQIQLPYEMNAVREYDGICLGKAEHFIEQRLSEVVIDKKKRKRLEAGETLVFPLQEEMTLEMRLIKGIILENILTKTYTKWLDYGKIKGNISVRGRRTGDYLTINDKQDKKTLKAYFINEKIPKEQRDTTYLVTDEDHVMWIIGNRISSYYKVGRDTKYILELRCTGGVENG